MFMSETFISNPISSASNVIEENRHRAEIYLAHQLDFNKVKEDLVSVRIITTDQLIRYGEDIHNATDKNIANTNVMSKIIKNIFKNEACITSFLKVMEDSVYYKNEASLFKLFLKCQKDNDSYWTKLTFGEKPYHFPPGENKIYPLRQNVQTTSRNEVDKTLRNAQNVNMIAQDYSDIGPSPSHNISAEVTNPPGNLSEGAVIDVGSQEIDNDDVDMESDMHFKGNANVLLSEMNDKKTSVGNCNVCRQVEVVNDDVNSIITSMGQVVVTPMEQSDDKIAAVFHQVKDYEDMSDKSNVDEVNVYEIAKKIGVPIRQIKGRIQTHRIGKVKKQTTRPLKVTFKDEQTRDSFLKTAREKSIMLEEVNIVPFVRKEKRHPFQFWKRNNREHKNKYCR